MAGGDITKSAVAHGGRLGTKSVELRKIKIPYFDVDLMLWN